MDIPTELYVDVVRSNLGGSVARILPICFWPHHLQLDQAEEHIPFFGPPPPNPFNPPNPPAAPMFLGPAVVLQMSNPPLPPAADALLTVTNDPF